MQSDNTQLEITNYLRERQIRWNFIPPNAPNFGGLWEAAVKSAKRHLIKVIGNSHLTFEEMSTILSSIESILNSRPLLCISSDPNDYSYLSPGHFLIGGPINAFPEVDLSDVNMNRLTRWQVLQQMQQHFWTRWSEEYLNTLQQRQKWREAKGPQLLVGQLVLMKQIGFPPMQWAMSRIVKIYQGFDKVARTALVKTKEGAFTRPISRLAILPLELI
ncbi:uncharacterized protein [Cardiocondyla obscurior]|uniref:uncharacterized protein n=1 Tax=Cardiocondyla obscurior TaxID=286306 RepID=UPI00396569CB